MVNIHKRRSASMKSIMILILILIFLSTAASVMLLFNYLSTARTYRDNLYDITRNNYTSILIQNYEDLSMVMEVTALDQTVRDNIFRTDVDEREMLQLGNNMRKIIESNTYLISPGSEVYAHEFFTNLPGDGRNFFPLSEMELKPWYTAYLESGMENYHLFAYSKFARSWQMILIHSINNFNTTGAGITRNAVCYEAMTVNLGSIMPRRNDIFSDVQAQTVLLDSQNGAVVYSTQESLETMAQTLAERNGRSEDYALSAETGDREYAVSITPIEQMNTTLVMFYEPLADSDAAMQSETTVILFIVAVFVVLSIVLFLFYLGYRRRIRGLVERLDYFKETSPVEPEGQKGDDELSDMDRHVVRMQNRIRTLIEEEYTVKLQMISAQHEALIACVNPHFLYNTLNTISSMASIEGAEDTNRMIYALSRMFRYSANVSEKTVTLEQELDNIRDYLHIQEVRFGNTFTFHIDAPEALLGCSMPKLILQPVVENCFKHGFAAGKAPARNGGKNEIDICVLKQGDFIEVYVMDNGRGIETEKLDILRKRLAESTAANGVLSSEIGLNNVHRRLQMVYGSGCGITLLGEKDSFTCVKITLAYRPAAGTKEE